MRFLTARRLRHTKSMHMPRALRDVVTSPYQLQEKKILMFYFAITRRSRQSYRDRSEDADQNTTGRSHVALLHPAVRHRDRPAVACW